MYNIHLVDSNRFRLKRVDFWFFILVYNVITCIYKWNNVTENSKLW